MRMLALLFGAVLALTLPATVAAAQPVDCDAAIEALVAARAKADLADPDITQLRQEQATLDDAVADAQAAVDDADPLELPALQAVLDVAVKAAADAQALLDETVAADKLLDDLVVAAQVKVAALCADGTPAVDDPDGDDPADDDGVDEEPTQVRFVPSKAPATG